MTINLRPAVLLAVGVLAGALIGGVAWASIPDGKGVIHGCYATASPHTLRVIDTAVTASCPSGTTALNWNKQGPPGPSNAYAAFHDAAVTPGAGGATVLHLSLGAGSYEIQAKTDAHIFGCASTSADCLITAYPSCTLTAGADSDTVSVGSFTEDVNAQTMVPNQHAPTSLLVVHSATGSFTASLSCVTGTTSGGNVGFQVADSKIVAIKVGSLSNSAE
jgi:hypothetical protein